MTKPTAHQVTNAAPRNFPLLSMAAPAIAFEVLTPTDQRTICELQSHTPRLGKPMRRDEHISGHWIWTDFL